MLPSWFDPSKLFFGLYFQVAAWQPFLELLSCTKYVFLSKEPLDFFVFPNADLLRMTFIFGNVEEGWGSVEMPLLDLEQLEYPNTAYKYKSVK